LIARPATTHKESVSEKGRLGKWQEVWFVRYCETGKTRMDKTRNSDLGAALRGLDEVKAAQENAGKKGLPPVHLWNPEFCGDLDMRIARDGSWFYMGTPIKRERLVRLFSTVLRYDDDGKYYLVTPVEKIGITVDDVPFVAVDMDVEGTGENQTLTFTTSVGDETRIDRDHPLRMAFDEASGEPAPYFLVRARLEALINRAVYYKLVDIAVEHEVDGAAMFGVWSAGAFYSFAPVADL
jgi:uncharacterized protein